MPKTNEQFDEMREAAITKLKLAGLRLFARKGLAATNIKEIASSAGVSLGLFYHYYKSKDELYYALTNEAMDKSQYASDIIKQISGGAKEKIDAFADLFLHAVNKDHGIYYFVLISQLPESDSEENRQLNARKLRSIQNLADIVSEGQALGECVEGDAFQLAATFISATQGIASFKLMFEDEFEIPPREMLTRTLLK